jgi:hypothetical protein
MEDVKTVNSALVWYFYVTKRRRLRLAKFKDNCVRRIALHNIKRKGKKEVIETVLAFFQRQRTGCTHEHRSGLRWWTTPTTTSYGIRKKRLHLFSERLSSK